MRLTAACILSTAVLAASRIAVADTTYTIVAAPVSNTGVAAPSTASFTTADIREVNASGVAVGISYAAKVGSPPGTGSYGPVQSVWYYDPTIGSSITLGLTGTGLNAQYTGTGSATLNSANSSISGSVVSLSNTGYAIGLTQRFNPVAAGGPPAFNGNEGSDAWIYSPGGTTVAIGPDTPSNISTDPNDTPANYLNSGNVASPTLYGVTDDGKVVGSSSTYRGGAATGIDLWVYDVATQTTTIIGLLDPTLYAKNGTSTDVTRTNATATTSVAFSGNTGKVLAYAARYNGGATIVSDDFYVYDVATNSYSGLIGYSYTAAAAASGNTYVENSTTDAFVDIAGEAVGRTEIVANTSFDAWYYEPGAGTVLIPLISGEDSGDDYHKSNGQHTNFDTMMSSGGQVAGTTSRYSASSSSSFGQDAWVYSGGANGVTTQVGLIDTTPDPTGTSYANTATMPVTRNSTPEAINASGQVAGISTRYNGASTKGSDTWLYTPGSGTVQIGLDTAHTNPTYTKSDGTHTSTITAITNGSALTNAGLVAGATTRVIGGASSNQDAWVYADGQTYSYTFATASDGTAYSVITAITDSTAVGYFDKYNASNAVIGKYAFVWNLADADDATEGFTDLGMDITNLVATGAWTADAAGSLLTEVAGGTATSSLVIAANGDIYGVGTLSGQSTSTSAIFGITPNLLLGDANGDGKVDLNDLNIVLNNLGTVNSARSAGNFDGAPTIDLNDLNDVLNNLGTGVSSPTGRGAAAPEPASLSILALAAGVLLRRRKCRFDGVE